MKLIALTLIAGAALLMAAPANAQAQSLQGVDRVTADAAGSLAPSLAQDQPDSLNRLGRNALNAGDYRAAVGHFRELRRRYSDSDYAADSYYWEAFALSKMGSGDDLKQAIVLLDRQAERHPDASTRSDGLELRTLIRGDLARMGDAESAEYLSQTARGARAEREEQRAQSRAHREQADQCDDDDDERVVALMALLQMRAERAVPILKQVLERRDEGSVCLRRQAMFIISQKRSAETAQIILQAVRSDPDPEVREQGVFWLSQVRGPEAIAALDSILQHAAEHELQEKAVFALSQHRDAAAGRALRDHLERSGTHEDIKENIIFWLGQQRSAENAQYLRDFYQRTGNEAQREKIIFSLSQMNLPGNGEWLMSIAMDQSESMEVRKNALFWAGQMNQVDIGQLVELYDQATDPELKEHLIFVLSQRNDERAVDQLMQIARDETNTELRRKAVFWLSQSNDPRVAEFLLEIINR